MLTVNLERLGLKPGDWLLDAGCGGGRHCFGAFDTGAHVVGLDLDLEGLAMTRAGLKQRQRDGNVGTGGAVHGNVFRLPFPDDRFDRVICSEVMEHVHDYEAAVAELTRVLRPGGSMAITIPTATTEIFYLRLTRDYFESPGGHIRIFAPRTLARAMGRAGLRVDGVRFAHSLHSPYWMLRAVLGLHDENPSPTRAYRRFLMDASLSPRWSRIERLLDWVWPKSLILYGTRVATGSRQ
ncbi:MAG: class I SAM-dependent methyltransferase [Deltaproteobacteria bacterium]|nr:class I SAM-dependent methyltransferase [Deltaproteobacteria bacterium]MBW2414365.1 class I SAM-dependent methyltransferase [Deltaproteobacteria bacterium]